MSSLSTRFKNKLVELRGLPREERFTIAFYAAVVASASLFVVWAVFSIFYLRSTYVAPPDDVSVQPAPTPLQLPVQTAQPPQQDQTPSTTSVTAPTPDDTQYPQIPAIYRPDSPGKPVNPGSGTQTSEPTHDTTQQDSAPTAPVVQ
jgi:hypothetical protein